MSVASMKDWSLALLWLQTYKHPCLHPACHVPSSVIPTSSQSFTVTNATELRTRSLQELGIRKEALMYYSPPLQT
eukprot:scaffold34064_cov121-Cyclotella_meneghiniana.AAC.6